MEIDGNALEEFLKCVGASIGDRRTARTIRGVVEGIIGGESLRCSQIAAFSPHI
jgi:hypothetical protein